MKRAALVLACLLSMISSPSMAGVADSPLPEIVPGETTYHVYSVPGVEDGFPGLATYFRCTSLDTVPVQVGIEGFLGAGGPPVNDAVATSRSLSPGRTEVFGTSFNFNIATNVDLGLGLMGVGSARILATSKKIMCTAFIADTLNTPPTSLSYLTIIAKTKQKAAN